MAQSTTAELRLKITTGERAGDRSTPAVVWLRPLYGTPATSFSPSGRYTLLQKNRIFVPHLQVVPVGAAVQFPNADPFFHNVFSLFDGKRFDLGLYEAGSSKSVTFSREGVSYIFCNIHPEMSAIVISLSTPTYGIASSSGAVVVRDVAPGDYRMELWVEGVSPETLQDFKRQIHLPAGVTDLGQIELPSTAIAPSHTNKFGRPYPKDTQSPY
jgi:plastocyanin